MFMYNNVAPSSGDDPMKKQTKYPVVLLHGMFGWGQQQLLERVVPYFGFYNVNIRKMFQKEVRFLVLKT